MLDHNHKHRVPLSTRRSPCRQPTSEAPIRHAYDARSGPSASCGLSAGAHCSTLATIRSARRSRFSLHFDAGCLMPHFRFRQRRCVGTQVDPSTRTSALNFARPDLLADAVQLVMIASYIPTRIVWHRHLANQYRGGANALLQRRTPELLQAMPCSSPSRCVFRRILCLEAAFHFPDRARFLNEAGRRRGAMVVVDFVWKAPDSRHHISPSSGRGQAAPGSGRTSSLWRNTNAGADSGFSVTAPVMTVGQCYTPLQLVFKVAAWLGRYAWGKLWSGATTLS